MCVIVNSAVLRDSFVNYIGDIYRFVFPATRLECVVSV